MAVELARYLDEQLSTVVGQGHPDRPFFERMRNNTAAYLLRSEPLETESGSETRGEISIAADARQAITAAQEEALISGENYISTAHLLLGILRAPISRIVLDNLGVTVVGVRKLTELTVDRGGRQHVGEVGLTPLAKKAIELAVGKARRSRSPSLHAVDILYGIIESGGRGSAVLMQHSVDLPRLERTAQYVSRLPSDKKEVIADYYDPNTDPEKKEALKDSIRKLHRQIRRCYDSSQ